MRVVGGSGGGKTRVLTYRIAWLVHEIEVAPENILALTFTNKAAGEMQARLAVLLGQETKSSGVTLEALRHQAEELDDPRLSRVCAAWQEYEKWQQRERAIDFDDLLNLAAELLEEDEIQRKIRSIHRYVLLDESQDTNLVQWSILRRLCPPPDGNLTVVGDYDQSIYGWRGAAAASFLGFVDEYAASTVKLETNYRSTQAIVKVANRLIEKNQSREDKILESAGGCRMRRGHPAARTEQPCRGRATSCLRRLYPRRARAAADVRL